MIELTSKTKPVIRVEVDFEKLKAPYSGLGQFCMHLAKEFEPNYEVSFTFFMPAKATKFQGVNTRKVNPFFKVMKVPSKANVWHATHQGAKYIPRDANIKVVLTIHDLIFMDKYADRPYKLAMYLKRMQKLIDRASVITYISEFTKKETRAQMNVPDIPEHVIYNGVSIGPGPSIAPAEKASKPFLFTIGIIQPKKNFKVLVEMMCLLPDLHLVIAGNDKWPEAEVIREKINSLDLVNRVSVVGMISEGEKKWYYENCQGLVFPSLTEGFGLPVVEAMHMGKPVFLSNLTSLPEIGGEIANYWESFAPDHMASLVKEGLANHNEKKAVALRNRAAQFSWENAAKEYIKVYQSVRLR